MVKITLEFPSVDAAIVAMAKLTKADGVTIVDGKARKGRADAGQPRGRYKKKAAGEGSLPEANTGEAPVGDSAPAPSPAAAPEQPAAPAMESPQAPGKDHEPVAAGSAPVAEATAKDAEAALETLFQAPPPKGGIESARKVLAIFGVQRLRELPAPQRGAFVEAVQRAMA